MLPEVAGQAASEGEGEGATIPAAFIGSIEMSLPYFYTSILPMPSFPFTEIVPIIVETDTHNTECIC